VWSATQIPSTSGATNSRPERSAAGNSAKACSVRATNRPETADLEVPAAVPSTSVPTGSSPTRYRRDDRLASIRSTANWSSSSVAANAC
jgi:hypothetical protein